MKFSRREKLLTKIFAYWCPICSRRFITKKKFEKHYFPCKYRHDMKVTERLEKIAPKNRAERRAMAKKAGQIKDWDKLNR